MRAWRAASPALVPFYEYDEDQLFQRRRGARACRGGAARSGFMRLAASLAERSKEPSESTAAVIDGISDLQFTARYRVPFQFSRFVRRHFKAGAFLESSSGVTVTDLDGNRLYDLTGSYGVNVFGYDFYKDCIARGSERVRDLGPVLGAYHPVTAYNVRRLLEISGLDEVSFHMSGTEAVMQAVRLARYHTRAQPLGALLRRLSWLVGRRAARRRQSARGTRDLYAEGHGRGGAAGAEVAARHRLRAGQPAAGAASESRRAPRTRRLLDSGRSAHFDRAAYSRWLQKLRAVCSERGIVLIFDEVFVGFRLAPGGAQEYFGVRADMVTYGKTVAGGLPVGVLCGTARASCAASATTGPPTSVSRAAPSIRIPTSWAPCTNSCSVSIARPSARSIAVSMPRGTGAPRHSNERLQRRATCRCKSRTCPRSGRSSTRGRRATIGCFNTICAPPALPLAWVGTGRLIFSLNYTDADFAEVADRILSAAREMQRDGWWWSEPRMTNKSIRTPRAQGNDSGALSSSRPHRIHELAAQQVERRLAVELHVVERVGDDLGQPHQPRLHVLRIEQLHGAEQQRADADDEPDLADVAHELLRRWHAACEQRRRKSGTATAARATAPK